MAAAIPCLCFTAQAAAAQSQIIGPPDRQLQPVTRTHILNADDSFRLRPEEAGRARTSAMIRSWAMEGDAEVGFGRFIVPDSARPRTHTERMNIGLDPETRRIAGAGMQMRF
jgi:hypothetical protein